jgi:pyridoxamine 5'-phosphate oxidase
MNPIPQLQRDWKAAKDAGDPAATFCALATVDEAGHPHVRTVVLWDIRSDGLPILTNTTSPKWAHLRSKPNYELVLLWLSLQRQYRIRGTCVELPREDTRRLWAKKRYELKLLDYYYARFGHQSTRIFSHDEFRRRIEVLKSEYPESSDLLFPETAEGLLLQIEQVDLWIGVGLVPERLLYRRLRNKWSVDHLVP